MNQKIIRIGVPYPIKNEVPKAVTDSINALEALKDCIFEIATIQGTYIHLSRNKCITLDNRVTGSEIEFDYFLSLDSDIVFKPQHVRQLLERDLDIVSGAYKYRENFSKAVAGYFHSEHGYICPHTCFVSMADTGLKEVDWVGAGFTLIKREVFLKMDYPFYTNEFIKYVDKLGIERAAPVGEDVGFCMSAKKRGFKIFVDMDCKVEHLL